LQFFYIPLNPVYNLKIFLYNVHIQFVINILQPNILTYLSLVALKLSTNLIIFLLEVPRKAYMYLCLIDL